MRARTFSAQERIGCEVKGDFSLRGDIAGWLSPRLNGDPLPTIEAICRDSATLFRARNLQMRVMNGRVRWHVAGPALTLVAGRPLHGGQQAEAATIHNFFRLDRLKLRQLRGRFSLVHVDCESGTLSLISDRFATYPLCWSATPSRCALSDRADCVPIERREIDPQAIFNYLYFHVIPAPRTIFLNVRRLEPFCALHWSASEGIKQEQTWEPRFAAYRRAQSADLKERFRIALRRAVDRELTTPRIGSFLSGGTDSSTVSGLLSQATGAPPPTFSIGFDAAGYDEISYARIAAKHFGTRHNEYYVTPRDLCEQVPRVAAHYDQPFGNSSAVPAYLCARWAAFEGVEKLLAGDGGDELFGGNSRYAKQKVFDLYWRLPISVRARVIEPLLAGAALEHVPVLRKAGSYVKQARIPMPQRTETYNLLARFGASSVMTPDLLGSVDSKEPSALQQYVFDSVGAPLLVDRMLAYDWRFTLADNDLPKVIGTAQLAGIDVGFPLLDDDLMDFSLELGVDDKVRGLRLRSFFKDALSDFLPAETIAKKKHGFGLPVGPWLLRDAPFRELARESLDGLVGRRLIQPAFVDDLFSARLGEHAGYFGEMIWVLMMLEQWLLTNGDTSARCSGDARSNDTG